MKKTFVLLSLALLCSGQGLLGNLPILGGLLPATGLGGIVGSLTSTLGLSTVIGSAINLNLQGSTSATSAVTNIAGGLLSNVGSDIQFIVTSATNT